MRGRVQVAAPAQPHEFTVGDLPSQVWSMQDCAGRHDLPALKRLAHQLKGAGGGYGFPQITEAAGAVEHDIAGSHPPEEIGAHLEVLIELIRRVEGYQSTSERNATAA